MINGKKRNTGFIALHRSIQEHWIWDDPIKLKWWLDILMGVNHSDQKVLIGFELIECKRGQAIKSLQTWGKRWRVDVSTVRRFFKLLRSDNMIVTENITKTTRLTVCNYDDYNTLKQDKQPRDNPKEIPEQFRGNTNNNVFNNDLNNEQKNEGERSAGSPTDFDELKERMRAGDPYELDFTDFLNYFLPAAAACKRSVEKSDIEKLTKFYYAEILQDEKGFKKCGPGYELIQLAFEAVNEWGVENARGSMFHVIKGWIERETNDERIIKLRNTCRIKKSMGKTNGSMLDAAKSIIQEDGLTRTRLLHESAQELRGQAILNQVNGVDAKMQAAL